VSLKPNNKRNTNHQILQYIRVLSYSSSFTLLLYFIRLRNFFPLVYVCLWAWSVRDLFSELSEKNKNHHVPLNILFIPIVCNKVQENSRFTLQESSRDTLVHIKKDWHIFCWRGRRCYFYFLQVASSRATTTTTTGRVVSQEIIAFLSNIFPCLKVDCLSFLFPILLGSSDMIMSIRFLRITLEPLPLYTLSIYIRNGERWDGESRFHKHLLL